MAPPPAVVSGAGYGIVAPGDLAVTQNGTPNMSVNVAAGKAFVDGTENANQGAYLCANDATVNLAIAASNPTNPRKDLVVAKVQDAEWSGATNSWSLAVVTGTAAAVPAEPAVPANAIVVALVDVAANATSITNANITDRRRRSSALGGTVVCTTTTRPPAPYLGQTIFETDRSRLSYWDGSLWYPITNGPSCRVFHNADQSIASGAETTVAFNQERFDPDGMHDPVTNNSRVTIPFAGVYTMVFSGHYQSRADYLHAYAQLLANGSLIISLPNAVGTFTGPGSSGLRVGSSGLWKFNAGDYVEVRTTQVNSAAAASLLQSASAYSPEFAVAWVGRG